MDCKLSNRLLLATNNPSKTHEISDSLQKINLEVLSLADFDKKKFAPEPPEDGETFTENARIKAEFWFQQTGISTLADDSGILVEALPGELGVRTVRFGKGENASDEEWLDYFLKKMKGMKNRKAKLVCTLAFVQKEQAIKFFQGEVEGEILEKATVPLLPRIPLSSVFLADGADKVFAAMSTTEKARFSHRGKALGKFREFIRSSNNKSRE